MEKKQKKERKKLVFSPILFFMETYPRNKDPDQNETDPQHG